MKRHYPDRAHVDNHASETQLALEHAMALPEVKAAVEKRRKRRLIVSHAPAPQARDEKARVSAAVTAETRRLGRDRSLWQRVHRKPGERMGDRTMPAHHVCTEYHEYRIRRG